MKKISIILSFVALLFLITDTAYSGDKAKKNFEKMKTLVGTWQSKTPDGSVTKITYKIVSNGSAIMEIISSKEDPGMISMYHLNNDILMMTHYCSAGNQPRMKAKLDTENPNEINFKYIDATNLKSEKDGHMLNLDIKFKDKDHLTHVWTWTKDGKQTEFVFDAERIN